MHKKLLIISFLITIIFSLAGCTIAVVPNKNISHNNSSNSNTCMIIVEAGTGGQAIGSGVYELEEIISLLATPDQGYEFDGWYIGSNLKETNTSYNYEVKASTKIVAKFIRQDSQVKEINGSYLLKEKRIDGKRINNSVVLETITFESDNILKVSQLTRSGGNQLDWINTDKIYRTFAGYMQVTEQNDETSVQIIEYKFEYDKLTLSYYSEDNKDRIISYYELIKPVDITGEYFVSKVTGASLLNGEEEPMGLMIFENNNILIEKEYGSEGQDFERPYWYQASRKSYQTFNNKIIIEDGNNFKVMSYYIKNDQLVLVERIPATEDFYSYNLTSYLQKADEDTILHGKYILKKETLNGNTITNIPELEIITLNTDKTLTIKSLVKNSLNQLVWKELENNYELYNNLILIYDGLRFNTYKFTIYEDIFILTSEKENVTKQYYNRLQSKQIDGEYLLKSVSRNHPSYYNMPNVSALEFKSNNEVKITNIIKDETYLLNEEQLVYSVYDDKIVISYGDYVNIFDYILLDGKLTLSYKINNSVKTETYELNDASCITGKYLLSSEILDGALINNDNEQQTIKFDINGNVKITSNNIDSNHLIEETGTYAIYNNKIYLNIDNKTYFLDYQLTDGNLTLNYGNEIDHTKTYNLIEEKFDLGKYTLIKGNLTNPYINYKVYLTFMVFDEYGSLKIERLTTYAYDIPRWRYEFASYRVLGNVITIVTNHGIYSYNYLVEENKITLIDLI